MPANTLASVTLGATVLPLTTYNGVLAVKIPKTTLAQLNPGGVLNFTITLVPGATSALNYVPQLFSDPNI